MWKVPLGSPRMNRQTVDAVAADVMADPRLFPELYCLTSDADRKLAWHALWVCEKLSVQHPEWFSPLYDELVERLLACPYEGSRRLLLSILFHLPIQSPISIPLLNFCFHHGFAMQDSPAVLSLCLRLAHRLCLCEPELLPELEAYLENLDEALCPRSVQAVVRSVRGSFQRKASVV